MRIFSDLKRGLLAAGTLAALGVACPAHAQYSPYPQTGQPYAPQVQQQAAAPVQQNYAPAVQQPVYSQQQVYVPQPSAAPQANLASQPAPYAPQQGVAPIQGAAPLQAYQQYATTQGYNPARPAPAVQTYAAQNYGAANSAVQNYAAQNYGAANSAVQNYAAQGYGAVQGAAQAPVNYAQSAVAGYAPAAQPSAPVAQPSPSYVVPRVAMAYQNTTPAANGTPAMPAPEGVMPSNAPGMSMPGGAQYPQPMAGSEYGPMPGAPMAAQGGAGCNCQGGTGYESYAGGATCGTAYGACNPNAPGACDNPGAMSRLLGSGGCNYWFGGVYGLLMDRNNGDKVPLTFTAPSPAYGYYPASNSTVLTTRNVDSDYLGGVELRLGRTFGGGVDPCSCACSCGPQWGLETVYWQLFENTATAQYVDNGTIRVYSMMDMRGLQYNNGGGYRPVDDYYDYAPPTADHTTGGDVEVRLARVSSSYDVKNLELNLLRLGICGGGCGSGAAMCNVGCDSGACGYDACAGGCAAGGCATACRPSRFSCTGVCGLRWLQFNDNFMYGVDFDNTDVAYPAPIDGYLNYWSTTRNDLVGFQLGCNGMYRIGCKWGLHLNSNFGLYGNDIDVHQYFVSPTNLVQFTGTGESFDARAHKTDVSMLGELRLGASYQATCHCRVYGGWRVLGISGIALATDQTPNSFLDAAQMANYVNSNGSLILHGLQTGVEWNY